MERSPSKIFFQEQSYTFSQGLQQSNDTKTRKPPPRTKSHSPFTMKNEKKLTRKYAMHSSTYMEQGTMKPDKVPTIAILSECRDIHSEKVELYLLLECKILRHALCTWA